MKLNLLDCSGQVFFGTPWIRSGGRICGGLDEVIAIVMGLTLISENIKKINLVSMVLYRSKNDVFVVRKCKFLEVLDFLLLLLVLLLELPRGAAGRLNRGGGCGLLLLDGH